MGKKVFIKFVSEPKNDMLKSIVGLACAAQAVSDGHDVNVFFAAAGTRLLSQITLRNSIRNLGPPYRWFLSSWRPLLVVLRFTAPLHR